MRAINLFSYPPSYQIPLAEDQIRIISMPHPHYEFRLRNGALLTSITWDDAITRPTSREADNLRSLIDFLKAIIAGHPELRQLPPLNEACA